MNNNSVIDQLKSLELEAIEAINNVQTEHNLNEVKASYLGKKSKLQEIMSKMKDLSIEEKKELGKSSNEFKAKVEALVEAKKEELAKKVINEKLAKETIDVTLPGKKVHTGYLHPLQKVIDEIEEVFIGMGYEIKEGPEVEEDLYNFEMLNIPKGHPARDAQDTFYLKDEYENFLLRSQTSTAQVRAMEDNKEKGEKIIKGRFLKEN